VRFCFSRPDDRPPSVNGLLWANADLEKGSIELQPFNRLSHHREWKLTTDAFPNNYLSTDRWIFPFPGQGRSQAVQTAAPPLQPGPAAEAQRAPPSSPTGWAIVDRQFLQERSTEETRDKLLQFYDGRPPTWRLAMSASVPIRATVERLRARFRGLEGSNKPTIVNLLGAGGEGNRQFSYKQLSV
jgi:hypothetical protein